MKIRIPQQILTRFLLFRQWPKALQRRFLSRHDTTACCCSLGITAPKSLGLKKCSRETRQRFHRNNKLVVLLLPGPLASADPVSAEVRQGGTESFRGSMCIKCVVQFNNG